jgi:U3 small nucleolar RNA-associated protein 18
MAPNRGKVARKVPQRSGKNSIVAEKLERESVPDYGGITEKDETEERLEKLIFGDEVGFLDSLKADTTGQELLRISSPGGEDEQRESDGDFEGVADEDVRSATTLRN